MRTLKLNMATALYKKVFFKNLVCSPARTKVHNCSLVFHDDMFNAEYSWPTGASSQHKVVLLSENWLVRGAGIFEPDINIDTLSL